MPLRYLESTLRQTACDFRKLSMYVTGADTSGKRLFDIWNRRFDKLPVISAKLAVHVTGDDTSEKASASSISEFGPWFLSNPAFEKADVYSISKLASSISELASSISEAPSSADF
ncbi:hypothetical protein ACFX1X_039099 [Malus domestica]